MDWSEIWRKESGSLTGGPSTKSRLRLMLGLLREYARPGATLLDVGCGKGELLERVAQSGMFAKLKGVDVSDVPLPEARRAVPGAEFAVLDLCQAALPEQFDVITCMMTLDLVPDDEQAARHLSEMLKVGGHLLVVVQHLKEHSSTLDAQYGVRRHDMASLRELLGRHGLEPIRMFAWGFPLFSAYYRRIERSTGASTGASNLPPALFQLVSSALSTVFRMDDLFTWTGRGRVLFGVFVKT